MHEFRNPQYSSADRSSIDVEINHPAYGWIPFTARADDVDQGCREVFEAAAAGTVADYVPPTPEELRAMMNTITKRQLRLGFIDEGIPLSSVTDVIALMPAGKVRESALVEWNDTEKFERLHPLVASISAALGMTPERVDELWNKAILL